MEKAIPLAVGASFCTATASVWQRFAASSYQAAGFDAWLVLRLARRPVRLAGLASMILGFVFQVNALRFGPLALVQPILALELLFAFGYMAVISRRVRVRRGDWMAAVAMSAGLGLFLGLAAPSGERHPFSASMLGLFLFGEHIRDGILYLAGEAVALAIVIAGVSALSHSHLIVGEGGPATGSPAAYPPHRPRERARR
jgi:hypothetical protein